MKGYDSNSTIVLLKHELCPSTKLCNEACNFTQQLNKEANDYVDSIADQMMLAVAQCIEAAGNEYEPAKQKDLLRVSLSWQEIRAQPTRRWLSGRAFIS